MTITLRLDMTSYATFEDAGGGINLNLSLIKGGENPRTVLILGQRGIALFEKSY